MLILKYFVACLLFSPTLWAADMTTPWTTQEECTAFCKGKCPKGQESGGNVNNGIVNAVKNEYCTYTQNSGFNCTPTGRYYCDCQCATNDGWST